MKNLLRVLALGFAVGVVACSTTADDSSLPATLLGAVECGSSECADGELCVMHQAGTDAGAHDTSAHDAGATNTGSCVAVPHPADCVLTDQESCSGTACECADRVCPNTEAQSVTGRFVLCRGQ